MKQFSKDLGNVCLAPKGKWSKEQEYERLALVYNASDNLSYVAKIDVPIGVEIDNREYWQPMNATGYSDNNFINLTTENENGTITAYESLEEAVATIVPVNRRAGATLSFYNLNADRLDRQAEFELWQFNSTDLANWENKDYWNNIYYNWNVFVGWYIGDDTLKNHVKIPNVGQYAYVGSNLNDAILYQCRTNGTWTNTGIKVRNYISVVVSGNITIGENGNWFSNGEDTGIPATPAVDEQLDNIIMQLQQHTTEINSIKEYNVNLQDQITSNDSDITNLTAKHESLSRTVQGIAATGGASTATNVTYDNNASGLNAENAQDAIDELDTKNKTQDAIIETKADKSDIVTELDKKFDKKNIAQEFGDSKDKVISQFALPFREIESPEFINAIVDAEDHFLFGIKLDGSIEWSKGIPAPIRTKLQEIINQCQKDKTDVLEAINAAKEELSTSITALQEKVGTIDTNFKDLIDVFSLQENPEYIAVEKDADGKVLSSTNLDGSHYIHKVKSETIPTEFEHIEDPEDRMEITTDAENKVMSYRDVDGKKHEHDMEVTNLEVSNLNLQGNSVNDISNALKANGFDIKGKTDWSDWYNNHDSALELPIPTKAVINITGVNQMPSKKLVNDKAYIEFFDFAGNYFKIKAYLNAQGASTMADPMKSCAIDLFSDDWGGNEFEIKFGDWVAQDGFHLKALYKDSLKSIQPICYEIGEQITSFLNVRSNRFHISSDNILIGGTGDMDNDVSQAKCMPSQFPCEVYLNGEYYGLFIWSLKKNRKNYSMNKKDYTSILIDNVGGMFNEDSFNWIKAEIRNPKKLICVDGEEYNADTHMGELIGTDTVAGQQYTFSKLNAATTGTDTFKVTSVDYNAANKNMVNTAKTKAIIEACQAYKSEVNSASTNEEKKKIIEKSFDVDNLLAYIIFCELTYNQDGLYNNAQITIYDKKVGYNIYDCDSCLGKAWNGILWTSSLSRKIFDSNSTNPLFVIKSLYAEEVGTMYKTLRDNGIITKENLNKIVDDWFDRLGTDTLKRSVTKWNNSPSYRKPTNLDEHWEPYIPLSKSELESINSYNAETNYSVGTIVCYGNGGYNNYYYKCVKECLGSAPTTDGNYFTNGMYDSKERIKMWLEKRIDFCDVLWNYKL